MKITVEHTQDTENEVILRCKELDDEMLRLLVLVRTGMQKLLVWNEQKEMLPMNVAEVVYCRLRSCGAGRNEAILSTTGERLMISRHYAPALWERLGMA